MVVKAPVYKAHTAVYNWTGCYAGVNAGYGWGRTTSNHTDDSNPADPFQGPGAVLPTSYDTGGRGALGGAQVGCNLQTGQFVFGLEGDIDAVRFSGSASTTVPGNGAFVNVAGLATTVLLPASVVTATEQVSERWLSTIRARVGFTVADRLLLFATGGLAVGSVSTTGSVVAGIPTFLATWSGSSSTTKTGFVVGAGAEYAFADCWTVKGEYLYFDLGNVSHPLNLVSSTIAFPVYASLGSTTARVNGSIARIGINYRFGNAVVANY
jgi:outer membrane immunogenic protein